MSKKGSLFNGLILLTPFSCLNCIQTVQAVSVSLHVPFCSQTVKMFLWIYFIDLSASFYYPFCSNTKEDPADIEAVHKPNQIT